MSDNTIPDIKVYPNFLSSEACDFLVSFAQENPQVFKCRKGFNPNYGLKRDLGEYVSCQFTSEVYGDVFHKYLNIDFNGFPVREIQLNKYEVDGFIPPHKDVQHSIHSVIVPLQDEPQNRLVFGDEQCYYDNIPVEESDKQNRTQSFPDIKGVGYNFDGIQPVHWVPPVVSKRYSATFLYSIK